jgi:hypothetical protein
VSNDAEEEVTRVTTGQPKDAPPLLSSPLSILGLMMMMIHSIRFDSSILLAPKIQKATELDIFVTARTVPLGQSQFDN